MIEPRTLTAAALALSAAAPIRADLENLPLPPVSVCQRCTGPITIDGKADEADWKAAIPLSPLRDIEGGAIADETRIRLLWDDQYLYVLAEMKEPDLRATLTEHDSVIYQDPDFEIFIDPDGDGLNYVEWEVNALGTTWDLFLPRPYRHGDNLVLHDWEMPGLRHAVALHGTLNRPGDRDEGWTVEVAIPWRSITSHASLPRRDEAPAAGSSLRMNFSRVNWRVAADPTAPGGYRKLCDAAGVPLPESNHVWAPTGRVNIHMPERWGEVILSEKPAGVWESRLPGPDEELRLSLYGYLNAQLEQRNRSGRFALSPEEASEAGCTLPRHARLVCLSEQHFVIEARSPRTGRLWRLDSEGRLSRGEAAYELPEICLWVHGNAPMSDTERERGFARMAEAGVTTVIPGGSIEDLRRLTPMARRAGLRVITWLWALNRPDDEEALRHPDWYAVSREGKSCHGEGDRPYVAYYQFLCPNHPEVRRHLCALAAEQAQIPGSDGVQLDYMRLPDVILPRALWEQYGLVQDRELPPYDFCYCERCLKLFAEQYGRAPLEDPTQDAEWREFRLASVARLANALCDEIRLRNKYAACAVFPTPEIAARLVRQDWSRFRLDLALPMDYYSFYAEPRSWLGRVLSEARRQTQDRMALAPGLHLPDVRPDELPRELDLLYRGGARRIALFCDSEFTPEHADALRRWLDALRDKRRPEALAP